MAATSKDVGRLPAPVGGIDQDVKLNRALWVLAQALRTQQAA